MRAYPVAFRVSLTLHFFFLAMNFILVQQWYEVACRLASSRGVLSTLGHALVLTSEFDKRRALTVASCRCDPGYELSGFFSDFPLPMANDHSLLSAKSTCYAATWSTSAIKTTSMECADACASRTSMERTRTVMPRFSRMDTTGSR
ncbi:uncharacterized protein LOC142771255 isoform X2 [Rhipicephalus microplus]|uniref:uncharacterized protein LOC142771255 isoform X2 n=1 Tax=Rhipicephalus microplus TaxID=6941 RepID=UPI003F6BB0C7